MVVPDKKFGANGAMIYADCGVVIDPNAGELAEIAIASADSCRALLNVEPRVAMLSFSTKGSAKHQSLDKIIEATKTVKARLPELEIDGELQADAALVPVSRRFKSQRLKRCRSCKCFDFPRLERRKYRLQINRKINRRHGNRTDSARLG